MAAPDQNGNEGNEYFKKGQNLINSQYKSNAQKSQTTSNLVYESYLQPKPTQVEPTQTHSGPSFNFKPIYMGMQPSNKLLTQLSG